MVGIFPIFAGDMTGKYSIYTLYEGHEIMFHVSTLLPFSRDNRQQVCFVVFAMRIFPRIILLLDLFLFHQISMA